MSEGGDLSLCKKEDAHFFSCKSRKKELGLIGNIHLRKGCKRAIRGVGTFMICKSFTLKLNRFINTKMLTNEIHIKIMKVYCNNNKYRTTVYVYICKMKQLL